MTRHSSVVVIGDLHLERELTGRVEGLSTDAPVPDVRIHRSMGVPGGAGLTALLSGSEGVDVTLLAPWSDDPAGQAIRQTLEGRGVRLIGLPQDGPTRQVSRVRVDGHTLMQLEEGGSGRPHDVPLPEDALLALAGADVIAVACAGSGTTRHARLRRAITQECLRVPVIWAMHRDGGRPVPGCALVTLASRHGQHEVNDPRATPAQAASKLRDRWQAHAVAVSIGGDGVWFASRDELKHIRTTPFEGDHSGAEHRLNASIANALAMDADVEEAVSIAVGDRSAWVASGGLTGYTQRLASGSEAEVRDPALDNIPRDVARVVRRLRATRGTLVALAGTYDSLNAAHVRSLESARSLGDALVVLVYSDDSARQLGDPDAPVQPASDRARVLRSLSCVDATIVVSEDQLDRTIATLKPTIWACAPDDRLPAAERAHRIRGWDGRVVLLPRLRGLPAIPVPQDTPVDLVPTRRGA